MEQRFPRRWDKKTCIDFLQRKIIINAILYYELNDNKLSDKQYDELSKQLVRMQAELSPEHLMETQYGYVMYDFDGTTGFDLYHRLNEKDRTYLYNIACHLSTGIKVAKVKKKKGALF